MSKIKRPVVYMDMEDSYKYKLIREKDGLTLKSNNIAWIEWGDDGRFKDKHERPSVGLSLILDPQRLNFTWLTTPITVILEEGDDYVKFKTKNSTYELFKL